MHFRNLIALILLVSAFAHAEEDGAVAVFQAVQGKVMFLSGKATEAKEGAAILPGTKIVVPPGGKARIVFDDDNTVDMGADTEMDVQEYNFAGHVLLKLWKGAVELFVQKKYDGEKSTFHIETKTAVVGVRGTEYTVQYADVAEETTVTVASGEVAIGRKLEAFKILSPESLKAGFEGKFLKGAPKATQARFDPVKFQTLREKIRTRIEPRHRDVLKRWRDRRQEILKKRGLLRAPPSQAPQAPSPEKKREIKDKRKARTPSSVFRKSTQHRPHRAFDQSRSQMRRRR